MKLKQQIAGVKRFIMRTFQIPLYYFHFLFPKTIVIDGGLGSQILGWIKYQVALETNDKTEVRLDTTYFRQREETDFSSLPTLFEWELHRYGIEIVENEDNRFSDFFKFSYNQQAKLDKKLFELMKTKNWSNHFPVSSETAALKNRLGVVNDYCVIHLRRGDYLTVATRVIGVSEVLKLVCKIQHLIPLDIILASDSVLESGDFEEVKSSLWQKNVQLLVGGEPHVVHGLMRESSLLITSNSTFSLSAGLTMSRGGSVILPKDFHGPKRKRINANFDQLTDWSIL